MQTKSQKILKRNIGNIKNNLRKDGRRSGVILDSGKPMPQLAISMFSNIKKEKTVLKI